ncbi:MAG: alpha-amylase/alpha-mannosidase [Planctomycetes bacterium]|nr:alpha-amylase/alpha-mannosidase [Planctomycetota bacterium]
MAEVALAFYWHQHQPYYPDDLTGENAMPWVRLHGVKDYVGMPLHLLEYPQMRCTINLVPSLLVQLLAYTERGASDRFLDVARISAKDLSQTDAVFLLDHFFMAAPEQMIRPWPRFWELYQRRGLGKNSASEALRRFNERDLRDLQTLYNLAWIHPLLFEKDADLRSLRDKGRHFGEEDKKLVLDKHLEILKQIIPLHRKLVESGQVELTTTPFYHPILPLLLDKRLAKEAMPDVKLPHYTGGYVDDAEIHVRRSIQFHSELFGIAPRGMWPAEGSVCQPMIPLLAKQGLRWIATDEGVLSQSTQGFVGRDHHGLVRNPSHLYRPYKVREGDSELGIVFRDHALSDMIGFHYQRSNGNDAAHDFVRHLHAIRAAIPTNEPALVSVILDGENCWEHYPEGGVPFLRSLYQLCTHDKHVRPVKIGEYLEGNPPRDTLPHLFAGSWIHHNFAIWIGHDEDNTAWDALHKAREYLLARSQESGVRGQESGVRCPRGVGSRVTPDSCLPTPAQRAWEELYIAEGSDWFWWYGDDHSCAQDALFDYLFRKHLQNVYTLFGDQPPAELGRPIKRHVQRLMHSLPLMYLDVKIDGRETFFEWSNAGRYHCVSERGTMGSNTPGSFSDIYFGFNRSEFFLRIDFDQRAKAALRLFDVLRIAFEEPMSCELRIDQPGTPTQSWTWHVKGEPIDAVGRIAVGIDRIAECSIPFELIGAKEKQHVQFHVELLGSQQSRDRAPRVGNIAFMRPAADFESSMWDV